MRVKYLFLCLLVICTIFFWSHVSADFPNQWFSTYKENLNGNIMFTCPKQCVIVLDDNSTILTLSGTLRWQGTIWYWILINDTTLYSAETTQISESRNEYTWKLINSPAYKQFKKQNPKVVLLVDGVISTNWIEVDQRNQSFSEKMSQFLIVEKLAPYSINLRYGPYRWAMSWPVLWLILSLMIIIIWPLVSGKKYTLRTFVQMTIGVFISVMVIGWMRILLDNIKITFENKKIFVESNNLRFNDLDDYIWVAKQIRQTLDLDNIPARQNKKCLINANAHQEWPYVTHWNFVYLRPCETTKTWSEADYIIYYKVPPVVLPNQQIILSGDTFTLLQNNK